jgi:hypothetical protein
LIPLNNILPLDNCLTQDQIVNYLNGATSAIDNIGIEQHFTNCELCSDAIDGLAILTHDQRIEILNNLPKQFIPKTGTTLRLGWQRVAAIASGVLFASIAGAWYYNSIYQQNNAVAKVETTIPSGIEIPSKGNKETIVADKTVINTEVAPTKIETPSVASKTPPTTTITTGKAQQINADGISNNNSGNYVYSPTTDERNTVQSIKKTPEPPSTNSYPLISELKKNENLESKKLEEQNYVSKPVATEKYKQEMPAASISASDLEIQDEARVAATKSVNKISKKQKDIYPSALQNNTSNYNYDNNTVVDNNKANTNNQAPLKNNMALTEADKRNTAFDIANTAFKNKNYKAAIVYYKSCIANNLNKDEAEYQLALSYKLNGDTQLADALFTKIKNANTRYKKAASEALSK